MWNHLGDPHQAHLWGVSYLDKPLFMPMWDCLNQVPWGGRSHPNQGQQYAWAWAPRCMKRGSQPSSDTQLLALTTPNFGCSVTTACFKLLPWFPCPEGLWPWTGSLSSLSISYIASAGYWMLGISRRSHQAGYWPPFLATLRCFFKAYSLMTGTGTMKLPKVPWFLFCGWFQACGAHPCRLLEGRGVFALIKVTLTC